MYNKLLTKIKKEIDFKLRNNVSSAVKMFFKLQIGKFSLQASL